MRQGIEQRIRQALTGADSKRICAEAGIDDAAKSRILSCGQGITIDKLAALLDAIGFVAVGVKYMIAVCELSKVGTSCECARSGFGQCGGN